MIETRPGIGHGTGTNPTVTPTVRPAAPSSGINLRPSPGGIAPPPVSPARPPHAEEPLSLVNEEKPGATDATKSKIHNITAATSIAQHAYKRPINTNKTGAVRMRTFHCRLSEQGVEYLDQTINDWLETHPDIEVKFTASTIGMWDGKLKEPTLIINVWY
jgi:hypothetical protein